MPNYDLITARNIYEEQGFVLLQATTPDEAKNLIEKITNTDNIFSYSEFGLANQRVHQAKSDPAKASTYNYGDAPNVPTMFHNEVAYNLKFPKHFSFWMKQQAKIGGATLLWDSVKACSEMKQQIPEFWEEYRNGGLVYCTNHPNEETTCGRDILKSWIGEGINTYSKSLQELLGVEIIDKLPNTSNQNPHINFSTTECGIKKCTHVRGMFNTSFGESCVNHLGIFSPQNFLNYDLMKATMHPRVVRLKGREITQEEWDVIYKIYEKPDFQHKLSNGELIIVNNLRFAHGRTPYSTTDDQKRQSTIFLYGVVDNSPID